MVSDGHRKCGEWIKGGGVSGRWTNQIEVVLQSSSSYLPGCVIRRLSACTRVPHREGNSMSEPPLLGDFLLAPACPIEKATLWVGLLY